QMRREARSPRGRRGPTPRVSADGAGETKKTRDSAERQPDGERAADARRRPHREAAVVGGDDRMNDREAEASAGALAGASELEPNEWLEDPVGIRRVHAPPPVPPR